MQWPKEEKRYTFFAGRAAGKFEESDRIQCGQSLYLGLLGKKKKDQCGISNSGDRNWGRSHRRGQE